MNIEWQCKHQPDAVLFNFSPTNHTVTSSSSANAFPTGPKQSPLQLISFASHPDSFPLDAACFARSYVAVVVARMCTSLLTLRADR